MKKIAFIDIVHPVLWEGLNKLGFECVDFTKASRQDIINVINDFSGIVIRSRFPLDAEFLSFAKKLEFIARSGAGLENVSEAYCIEKQITLFNAPEGNRNAVGEHALGMLLSLFNNLCIGDSEVRKGFWNREKNRGIELDGKVVGIIGFGNNGAAFAKKMEGFDVEILAYDKYKTGFGTSFVNETELSEVFEKADVLSLHIPQNQETLFMIDSQFISQFKKSIYIINLSRGKILDTNSLVSAIKEKKVLGACLDVLEYEKASFEDMFSDVDEMPKAFQYLLNSNKVIFSPHVGGWTNESYYKLSEVLLEKIKRHYFP